MLNRARASQVGIAETGRRIVPYLEYVAAYGDPATNGKGHERIVHEGEDCVRFSGPKEWTERVIKRTGVRKERGSLNLRSPIHIHSSAQSLSHWGFLAIELASPDHTAGFNPVSTVVRAAPMMLSSLAPSMPLVLLRCRPLARSRFSPTTIPRCTMERLTWPTRTSLRV